MMKIFFENNNYLLNMMAKWIESNSCVRYIATYYGNFANTRDAISCIYLIPDRPIMLNRR